MKQYASIFLLVFILFSFAIFTGEGGAFSRINFHPQSEETNSLRLYLLINMICVDLFREILSHFVSTAKLPHESLKDNYWIHSSELNWFYTFLRDICNISPHRNGWGNPPESKDNCASACIERIKIKSLEIRSPTDGVSNPIFEDTWKNLRSDIVEIERQVLDGHLYEKRVDDLFSKDTYLLRGLALKLRNIFESGKNVNNNNYGL